MSNSLKKLTKRDLFHAYAYWMMFALAAQNMELVAASLGLGALFNGYLCRAAEELPAVKAFLEAENKPLQICMLLGHPAVSYRRTAPRRAGDFVMK